MTNLPLVSTVIPVYNVKGYLPECIDSVLAQTYQNLEIILIDDGSTDGSEDICDQYKSKDSRIIVKHQKNAGLSSARNTGIKRATGKFIVFIDSDDYVRPELIEHTISAAMSYRADIVVFGYNNNIPPNEIISGKSATIQLLTKQENIDIIAWNKLYKAKLFSNIKFPDGETHEDNLTTYKLLSLADKVVYLPESLYIYRERPGSITAKKDVLHRLNIREQTVTESRDYLDATYKNAIDISLLLAKFARLDASLRSDISNDEAQKTLSWLKRHRHDFDNNNLLTKKLTAYLELATKLGGVPYKALRKLFHE